MLAVLDKNAVDEHCKICPCLCKRLGTEDEPVHYYFTNLTPASVINLVETMAIEYKFWELVMEQHAQSSGPQLALRFKPKTNQKTSNSFDLLIIAQASNTVGSTDLWLRYSVPEACCEDFPLVMELSEMVQHILRVLNHTNDLLAAHVS